MTWTSEGPRPGTGGQCEGITDLEVVGAVNAVVPHPTNSDILYIGTVNGGVWRSSNALAAKPNWSSLMSNERSLSVGALCLDRSDPSAQTIVAGTGRFSSMLRDGGSLEGVMKSTDGGQTWTVYNNGGLFRALHICSVSAYGDNILLSGNASQPTPQADGVYLSEDGGLTFTHLSGTTFLRGKSYSLARSRETPSILYAQAGRAIYSSSDTGASWARISNTAIESLLIDPTNVKISIGPDETIFVAIAVAGRLQAIFRSTNNGSSWTNLDLPSSVEAKGAVFGLHPGRQANTHFSLAADPNNKNVVYIGGDRQPGYTEGLKRDAPNKPPLFPNSVGAYNYSGRIYRVDASKNPGQQAVHVTHNNTYSNSAPHADSRTMSVAANGDLIQGDDGGVYRLTNPLGKGDWFSMIGTLEATEIHSVAWDPSSKVIMGGTQDNGTLIKNATTNSNNWPALTGGDGGVVAVAQLSSGRSIRYFSTQYLGSAYRHIYDSQGNFMSGQRLLLQPVGAGRDTAGNAIRLIPQFYTPIAVNHFNPMRIVFCGHNRVWESYDRGDTLRLVSSSNIRVDSVVLVSFGSSSGASDTLYLAAREEIHVRKTASAGLQPTVRFNEPVTSLTHNSSIPSVAFATLRNSVLHSTDYGQTWTDVTGNLLAAGGRKIRSIAWCENIGQGHIIVGTNSGIYAAEGPNFLVWGEVGTGMPTVPVMQLKYDAKAQILMAATLGRGTWSMPLKDPLVVENDDIG